MDVNEERLVSCESWAKAEFAINALYQPKEQLAVITDGNLASVVFDATGNAKSMTDAFDLVAHGGALVYVGLAVADKIYRSNSAEGCQSNIAT